MARGTWWVGALGCGAIVGDGGVVIIEGFGGYVWGSDGLLEDILSEDLGGIIAITFSTFSINLIIVSF